MNIGKIIAINYGEIKVRISTEVKGNSVNIQGKIYYFGNIGGYVKTENALNESIVCEVVSIVDNDPAKEKQSFNLERERDLILIPLGTLNNRQFQLGIGVYPSLYSDVKILTQQDMKDILDSKPESSEDEGQARVHKNFQLGVSMNLINYQIDINIDRFFAIHSAVIGNSGSGKSNTIAHILQTILLKQDYSAVGAKVILFDVNGEYKKAFEQISEINNNISVKFLKPNLQKGDIGFERFVMPHFLMNLDEWCSFLLASEATQRPFWDKALQESMRFYELKNFSGDDDNNDIIHYIIYKICSLVNNVLAQVDSDTSRMTSANALLQRMLRIITEQEFANSRSYKIDQNDLKLGRLNSSREDISCSIQGILNALINRTDVSYARNQNVLQSAVSAIQERIDTSKVEKILDKKHEYGSYYSYEFLKIAAEICLLEEDSLGSRNMRNWTSTLMTRLDYFLENPECSFMREGDNENSNTEIYLKDRFGIAKDNNCTDTQVFIIDLSEMSPDVLEILTAVIARLIFDARKTAVERAKNPVHLILDEAHRYIKKDFDYKLKENVFDKIAREGRKYSYYLLVSSQRPSELSETVLSQCGNYIVHQLHNERDLSYVRAIMPFYQKGMDDKIRQSVPGEALVFGNCVPMPLQVKIIQANPEPNSENCLISKEWFKEKKKG